MRLTEKQMKMFGLAYCYGHDPSDKGKGIGGGHPRPKQPPNNTDELKIQLAGKEAEVRELRRRLQVRELEQDLAAKEAEVENLRRKLKEALR